MSPKKSVKKDMDKDLELAEGDAHGTETIPKVGEQPVTDPQEADDEYAELRKIVAKEFSVEPEDLDFTDDDYYDVSVVRVSGVGPQDILIFDDYDDVEEAAENAVREILENEPELFNQEWLSRYVYMPSTDIRLTASDDADSWVENMDDDEILKAAGLEDEYATAEAWEQATEEEREELEKPNQSPDEILEKAKEIVRKQRYEDIVSMLKDDPIGYLVDELGAYTLEEVLKVLRIDIDAAAKAAVREDGAGHFLSSYDGEVHELKNGQPYIFE